MPEDTRDEKWFPGLVLTPEQVEFALAMERYMRLKRRPFPAWHEVLAVLRALGYRKVAVQREPRPPSE
jgi:hypothetical protein